jgi:[ribosomal protein S5]-alanine N-acetyltransferase
MARVHEPVLTERLRLRPFTPEDLPRLHELWSHPDVARWTGGPPRDEEHSREQLDAHLHHQAVHGYGFWAVEPRAGGPLIGEIGLMQFELRGPEVEIGWALDPAAQGRGYAHEAAARWLELGFGTLALDRVIAVVLAPNAPSRRLAARLGMRETGTRHAYGREHVLFEVTAAAGTRAAGAWSGARR